MIKIQWQVNQGPLTLHMEASLDPHNLQEASLDPHNLQEASLDPHSLQGLIQDHLT